MSVTIHPTAVVGPKVELGDGCVVGPYCVLENVKAGKNNVFYAHVSAGTAPQDLTHKGEEFFVVMGDNNTFREFVTLNRGTKHDTVIGSNCFLMAYSHVAHDCRLGDGVITANGATLAGHVEIGDNAFLSGFAALHQFTRVGRLAMLSGLSGAVQDLPPFCTATGGRAGLAGLNLVGMRRNGVPRANIAKVREAYKVLFLRGQRLEDALAQLKADNPVPEVQQMISFIESSKRGVMRPRDAKAAEAETVEA